jgi:predicted kinase
VPRPHLIVVAGPPASGKTTLARELAKALRLPLICKDTVVESLYDHLGLGDRVWSQRLGFAAIHVLYALARECLEARASLILESTFVHPSTPGELHELTQETDARLSVVYCHATPEVLAARFNRRAQADRHPGHLDASTISATEIAHHGWLRRPRYPGPVISVDTTDPAAISIGGILEQLAH